jgi:hypothetical protein
MRDLDLDLFERLAVGQEVLSARRSLAVRDAHLISDILGS